MNNDLKNLSYVLKSKELKSCAFGILGFAITLLLDTAFNTNIILINFFVYLVQLKLISLIFFTPYLVLLLNNLFKLNLSRKTINLCETISKRLIKSMYFIIGFYLPLLIINMFFANIYYIIFFGKAVFVIYLVNVGAHWILLDMKDQSIAQLEKNNQFA